jgi:hypothetical protein
VSPRFQYPTAVTPDRTWVFYQQSTEQGTLDVMSVSVTEPGEPAPVFASSFSEVARDGRILGIVSGTVARELPVSVIVNWSPPL